MTRDIVRLAGCTVAVPDPDATASFLVETLELRRREDGDRQYLTVEGDYGLPAPDSLLVLQHGPELQLVEVRFELAADADADGLVDRLRQHGVEPLEGESGHVEFTDGDGLRVVCSVRRSDADRVLPSSIVRPRRLGHVNIKVPHAQKSAAFYAGALGLRLSEQVGELLYFFRVGSDHHNFGIRGNAERLNVHHIAFEVPGWDYYRSFCDRLSSLGHVVEYGPGRHGPGHNLFVYFVDPSSGLRIELFADMAHIEDDGVYEPIRWETVDRARTVNQWGPGPPASFLE